MLQQYFRNGVAQGLYDPDHESAPGVPLTTPTANGQGNPQQGQAGNPAPNAQPGGMDPAMAAMLAQQQAQQRQGGVGGNPGQTGITQIDGLSPGRTGLLGGIARAAGMVNPVLGFGAAAMNAGRGAIAGEQQLAAQQAMTGATPTMGSDLGAAAAGAFGMGGLSAYGHGLGGYGRAGQGGYTGLENALDPGVSGSARAMSATAAQAVQQASQNPSTNNPDGYRTAIHEALDQQQGGGSAGYSGTGGGDGQSGGSSDTAMSHAGFASGGFVQGGQNGAVPTRGAAARPGLVAGRSPGQADALNRAVPQGSFIVPASVVSALGQGNTAAGAAALHSMMTPAGPKAGGLQPQPMSMAGPQPGMSGGHGGNVRTQLSGGEFEITPQQLAALMANPQGAQLLKTIMGAMPKPAPQQQPGQMPPQQPMPPPMQGQGQGQGQPPPQGPPPQGPPQ